MVPNPTVGESLIPARARKGSLGRNDDRAYAVISKPLAPE